MLLNLTELSSEPIHSQISRQLRARILSGELAEKTSLPASRPFARQQRVDVRSVERAYEDLQREGLVVSSDDDAHAWWVATVSVEQKREMAQRKLLENLREQELSVKELELARDIQCRLLPPPEVAGRGFTVSSRNEPARFVAGDFYDVIRHEEGSVGVVVADVAGKGFGASLIMASVKAMMPFLATGRSVEETLGELNRRLCRELGKREFIALAYARFDPTTRRLSVANAGLPDPYLLRRNGSIDTIAVPGERLPLGLRRDVAYESRDLELQPGERLLLFSDGMPEARRKNGEPLGYEDLEAIVRELHSERQAAAGEPWLDQLLERVRSETLPEIDDDWTAVVLESRQFEAED
jgi:sigma-B regulation protein RsbU (phosphoserine phosphatase)